MKSGFKSSCPLILPHVLLIFASVEAYASPENNTAFIFRVKGALNQFSIALKVGGSQDFKKNGQN